MSVRVCEMEKGSTVILHLQDSAYASGLRVTDRKRAPNVSHFIGNARELKQLWRIGNVN